MKDYDSLFSEVLHHAVRGMNTRQAIGHLVRQGLINRTACERLMVRREVSRLAGKGVPRCEALMMAADSCCCSYEKARGLFYDKKC